MIRFGLLKLTKVFSLIMTKKSTARVKTTNVLA